MFCSKCGVSAVSQQVFCSSCGNRLVAQSLDASALNYPSFWPGVDLDGRNAPAPMNLVETIDFSYKNYARFSGRASRSEYWYWVLFSQLSFAIVYLATALTVEFENAHYGEPIYFAAWLSVLSTIIPGMARGVRRLHDTNRSGGFLFLLLIPFVGSILLLVYFCTDGDAVPNRYGPPSKRFQKI